MQINGLSNELKQPKFDNLVRSYLIGSLLKKKISCRGAVQVHPYWLPSEMKPTTNGGVQVYLSTLLAALSSQTSLV